MVTSLSNVSDACWPSVNMENSILCVGTNQLVKTNDAIIDNSYINKDNDITDSKHSDTETLDSSHKRNETTSGNGSKQIRPNTMIDINANSDSFIVDQSSQGNSIKPDARVGFGQQSNELSVSVKTHIHGQQQEQVYENNNQQLLNHHQQQNQQQQQQAEHKTDNSSPSTLKKGMLWQQIYGRLFNRWKERFFILTDDYLVCFKKSSKVGHSEMGSFLYKTCLVDVENLSWASKKKDGVICLRTVNQPCLVLWSNKGLDNWMYSLKNAIDSSKSRREILVQKSRTLSPSIGKQQAHEQNGTGKSNGNIRDRCTTYSCPPTPNSELIQEPIRSDSPFEKNFNSSTKQILMTSEANGLKLSGHAEEPINSHANNNRNNWHPTDADSSNERQTSKRLLSPTASSGRLKNGCNNNNASRFISNENKRDKMCISSTSTINRMQQHLTALSSLNVLNDSQEDVSHLDGSTNSNVRALRESGDALQLNSTDYGNERGQNNNNADKPSLGSPKLLPQEQQSQHQGFVKRSEDEQHSFLSRASDREALDSVPHPRPLIRRDESWQSLMSLTRINRPKPKLFSYSGSPIMHQRSLYAQHIMDDNQYGETRRNSSSVSTPIKSRVPLRPEIFEHNQFVLKYLRQTPVSNTPPQHQTQKTNNASLRRLSSSNSSSTNEYSTNEFCFIRPDSTLPNLSSRSMQFPAQNSSSLLPGNVSDMNSHRTNLSPSYYLNPIQTDQQHQSTSGVLSASDTEAPGRELPLKPNRKRRPKKKSQQGSVMSFLRRAFHRRPSSPQNAAEILTESGFAFDESKLFYPTIVTNTLQGSISTNRSPAGPRMVDIVAAFANQTLIDDAQEDAGYGTEKACSIQLSKNDSQSTIRDSKAAFISNHAADGFQGSAMRTDPSTNSSVTIPQFSPQPQPRSALFGQLTPSARRRQTFMSNGRHLEPRPSSIYGLPSMVSPVSSGLSERNGLNNIHHRNSTQYSRDGSLVMMLPSLDTTREVAEEIASPTSEQANYVQDGNDAMQTLYDNMPPNESARSRYISNQLIMDNDDVEKNVVIPFHRPPAHAVYDNFSNEKSLHSFYDNHSPGSPSLYKSNKVSDSVPSHLSKATLQEMGAQRTSFIGSTSQSPTAGMPYQKPAAIVAPTASTNMNHPATPRYLQPQRTIVHINQVPQRGCSPALSRRTTGSQHMISRSHTSHHVMSISHNQTESAIDVGGVKLEPKLAASLLGNSIDVDNFNSFQRHSCKFSNRSANTTSIEAQPRAFLVSTRLTKSICNNNSQLSTPSRYIQQTEKTQPLSSGIFSKEDIR